MAILEDVPDEDAPRVVPTTAPAPKKKGFFSHHHEPDHAPESTWSTSGAASKIPLAHPSASTRAKPSKPLVQLSQDDLRAAGVQFLEMDAAGVDAQLRNLAGEAGVRAGGVLRRGKEGWEGSEGVDVGSGSGGNGSGNGAGGAETGSASENEPKKKGKGKNKKAKAKATTTAKHTHHAAPPKSRTEALAQADGFDSAEETGADGDDEDDVVQTPAERAAELWWDEFFDSMILTVPFSMLYLMLDVLTNLSYARPMEFSYFAKNYIAALPVVGLICFYTSRYHTNEYMRMALLLASVASGARLIWLVNKASYLTVMEQGPAAGTLWILTIVQLPLSRAVAALAVVAAWGYGKNMKLKP